MLKRPYPIKPPVGAQINWGHPLAQGLVGCWLMNEGGGLYVNDLSGRGNKGTLTNGPLWVPGRSGPALFFDGLNDYVNVADSSNLRPPSAVSVTAWVKFNNISASSGWQGIGRKEYGGNSESYGLDVSNDQLRFIVRKSGNYDSAQLSLSWTNGQWYFVVGTFDATVALRLYRDGVEVGSDPFVSVDIMLYDTSIFTIGYQVAANAYFKGLIDGVRIYNRALRREEIQWLYTDPYAMFEQPRRGKWFFVAAGGTNYPRSVDGGLAWATSILTRKGTLQRKQVGTL